MLGGITWHTTQPLKAHTPSRCWQGMSFLLGPFLSWIYTSSRNFLFDYSYLLDALPHPQRVSVTKLHPILDSKSSRSIYLRCLPNSLGAILSSWPSLRLMVVSLGLVHDTWSRELYLSLPLKNYICHSLSTREELPLYQINLHFLLLQFDDLSRQL